MNSAVETIQNENLALTEGLTDEHAWDAFVKDHPEGSFYHLSAWQRLISKVFGHRPLHIVAREGETGKIQGILPLFYVRSRIFGRMLISTPHAAYGGVLANSGSVYQTILDHAAELARKYDVKFLELRNFRNAASDPTLVPKDLYVTFRHTLDSDVERMFAAIPKKTRYEIRESLKHELEFKVDAIGCEEFFDIYSRNVRLLGTPVFPSRIFTVGREAFGPDCRIFSVHHQGTVISAAWTIFYKDEYLPHFACSLREYNHLSVNNFMYWMMLKWGAENGYRTFDFGRSKRGTGSFNFKKHWGMNIIPLDYQYALVGQASLPDTSPLNPKFSFSIEAWKRLPLSVTRIVGPLVSKHLI